MEAEIVQGPTAIALTDLLTASSLTLAYYAI
jgi:hypothetical protein